MEKQKESKMILKIAEASQINQILSLYKKVIDIVAKTFPLSIGWNIDIYPSLKWITESVSKKEMLVFCDDENIVGACSVNYSVHEGFKLVDWKVKEPENKISSIHAFYVNPDFWKTGASIAFLKEVIDYCRKNGDIANHLDVFVTNERAIKLYKKAGFEQREIREMFYESEGIRKCMMMEFMF